jgi:hypothetical protein
VCTNYNKTQIHSKQHNREEQRPSAASECTNQNEPVIQGNKYNTAQIQHEAVQALKDTTVKETASQQHETSKYTKYGNCINAEQNIVYIVMHSNCIAATNTKCNSEHRVQCNIFIMQ